MTTAQSIQTVLVIGYVWPEPNSSAAGRHMLSLLTLFVEQGWAVTFASPAVQGEHKLDLAILGIAEQSISLNCPSFDTFIATLSPELVLFDRFMLEEQFAWRVAKYCPDALRMLDTEDLHFLRHARRIAFTQQQPVTDELLKGEMAQREIAAVYRCDLSLIISSYETELLLSSFGLPSFLLHHCPFMLDLAALNESMFIAQQDNWPQREHFISIGNFRHEPNWNAVLWLKAEIWPLIRAALPQAELHIYGAYPPPKATQLHNPKQGFIVKGWADDAPAVMRSARVCLAPLRFGAGLKGKLAEAMTCGTPSVSTPIGAEGMGNENHWPGVIANTPDAIAKGAIALYQQQTLWQSCQAQGYALLKDHFDRRKLGPELITRIQQVKGNLAQHRLANFTGTMLQHHQHKSTQYMAQWIEAKNQVLKTNN